MSANKINIDVMREHLALNEKTGVLTWKIPPKNNQVSAGDSVGGVSEQGYIRFSLGGVKYMAHRVVYAMLTGLQPEEVDHIDGDRQNNKIDNLRAATKSTNQRNVKRKINNTSGFTGVYWHKQRQRWVATIRANNRAIHLCETKCKNEAVSARLNAQIALHGDFANNFGAQRYKTIREGYTNEGQT
jgi:HNH endonuclease/AP2 domain